MKQCGMIVNYQKEEYVAFNRGNDYSLVSSFGNDFCVNKSDVDKVFFRNYVGYYKEFPVLIEKETPKKFKIFTMDKQNKEVFRELGFRIDDKKDYYYKEVLKEEVDNPHYEETSHFEYSTAVICKRFIRLNINNPYYLEAMTTPVVINSNDMFYLIIYTWSVNDGSARAWLLDIFSGDVLHVEPINLNDEIKKLVYNKKNRKAMNLINQIRHELYFLGEMNNKLNEEYLNEAYNENEEEIVWEQIDQKLIKDC